MNFKFLIVLTIVLCAFCVMSVNASEIESKNPNLLDLGINPTYSELSVTYSDTEHHTIIWKDLELIGGDETTPLPNIIYTTNYGYTDHIRLQDLINTYGYGVYQIEYEVWYEYFGTLWTFSVVESAGDYDIIIENDVNNIDIGNTTKINHVFTIGSNNDGNIINITSYSANNCYLENINSNYCIVILDLDLSQSSINFAGNVDYNGNIQPFETSAVFTYNYHEPITPPLPTNEIQVFIQTFDYQSGNMVTGVNMSVYEVIDNGDSMTLGNMVYSSISSESQTILMLKNNTDYFVKNELGGYLSVKNSEYPLLNNEVGYLWTPSIVNPLILYYSRLDPTAQYNVGFIVQDTSNNGLSGVSVTMDNSVTKITNSIGGVTFNNVSSGSHTFSFVKNGYQSAQITKNIQMQYATFTQTLFADNQIIQPTTQPTAYPTIQPSTQPTIKPIEQPKNIADSVKYGLAKVFGVNSVDTINLIFALIIILFPAVVGGVITNQAMGFVSGGMIGFVFALAVGLIPIWVFFSMVMLAVIYLILTTGNNF